MIEYYKVLPDVLDDREIEQVIAILRKEELSSFKSPTGRCSVDNKSFSGYKGEIYEKLTNIVRRTNKELFNFNINSFSEFQYTIYGKGNEYLWHSDINLNRVSDVDFDRKLTCVLQLSNKNNYKGGEFLLSECFGGDRLEVSNKGSMVVFPTFIPHSVSKITEGTRESLVFWAYGNKFL